MTDKKRAPSKLISMSFSPEEYALLEKALRMAKVSSTGHDAKAYERMVDNVMGRRLRIANTAEQAAAE